MIQRLPLPYRRPPLSLNDRDHWRAKAKVTAELRELAVALVNARCDLEPVDTALVTLHYRPADKRARDAINMSPTLKPITDGLVDAGLLKNGDDSRYVTETCHIWPAEKGKPAEMWVTVESPRPEPGDR